MPGVHARLSLTKMTDNNAAVGLEIKSWLKYGGGGPERGADIVGDMSSYPRMAAIY